MAKKTAAAYRALKATRRAKEQTFKITAPSGFEFEVRKANLEMFFIGGNLPSRLTETVAKETKKNNTSAAEDFSAMPVKDQLKSIVFVREIVRDICVNPRIVDNPENDDEIAPHELELDDFNFLAEWAMENSGSEVERLKANSFRSKS